jgi:hypothetical protein
LGCACCTVRMGWISAIRATFIGPITASSSGLLGTSTRSVPRPARTTAALPLGPHKSAAAPGAAGGLGSSPRARPRSGRLPAATARARVSARRSPIRCVWFARLRQGLLAYRCRSANDVPRHQRSVDRFRGHAPCRQCAQRQSRLCRCAKVVKHQGASTRAILDRVPETLPSASRCGGKFGGLPRFFGRNLGQKIDERSGVTFVGGGSAA